MDIRKYSHKFDNNKVETNDLLKSDHKLVIMTLESEKFFRKRSKAQKKCKNMKRKIYEIEKMSKDNWVYFRDNLNGKIKKNKIETEFVQTEKTNVI